MVLPELTPMGADERAAIVGDVHDAWQAWLRSRGSSPYGSGMSSQPVGYATDDEGFEGRRSGYDQFGGALTASPDDLLALQAMLIARGLNPNGTRR